MCECKPGTGDGTAQLYLCNRRAACRYVPHQFDDERGRLGDVRAELKFWYCYSPPGTPIPPTPTMQAIPDVIINYIEPGSYRDEYAKVKNRTLSMVNLKGWRITSKKSD